METQALRADVREGRGKGAARRLRSQGKIPAVVYGKGSNNVALAVSPRDLSKALSTEYGLNAVLKLTFSDEEQLAMVKDLHRHPVERHALHVDFYRVTEDQPVTVRVPFATTGRPVGVQKGGKMTVVFRDLPVQTTPSRMPSVIRVDVSALDMGSVLQVKDLQLPEGVSVLYAPERRLVLVGEDKRRTPVAEEETAATGDAAAAAPESKESKK